MKPAPFMRVLSAEGRHHPDNEPITAAEYDADRQRIIATMRANMTPRTNPNTPTEEP